MKNIWNIFILISFVYLLSSCTTKDVTKQENDQDIIVDLFTVSAEHPRYTEGSVIALGDGSLLYSISEFSTGPGDHAIAHIMASKSHDSGKTWLKPFELQENIGTLNVMSSTLRRLGDLSQGDSALGHFFLVKNSLQDLQCYLRISHDEGETFGDLISVSKSPGYNVMNNDRILRLNSGRLLAPMASTIDVENVNHFVSYCTYSDDQGLTWQESENRVDYARRGAMEPEVIEFKDGRIGMIIRTQLGHLAISYSKDRGKSWGQAESWKVRSSESPATCRRIPTTDDLLLIWNDNCEPGADHEGLRIPLTAAISDDEGKTWKYKRNLETGPGKTAAYSSLTFVDDRVVLSYTLRSDETKLRSHRFRSLPISWFYKK
jgi:sialidase-1